MAQNGASVQSAISREELLQQGVPAPEANRIAVRTSLQVVLETSLERWGRWCVCILTLLVLGFLGVLIWSQFVYSAHQADHCDQPLAPMLRLLYIILAIQVFQRDIIRNCLCYNMQRDGPFEPCRVRLFRRVSLAATVTWPVVAIWMLIQAKDCSRSLKVVVRVITAYYGAVGLFAVIIPTFFITGMMFLVSRGLVRLPRSANAAPDDLIDTFPTIAYDATIFTDGEEGGSFPAACPICLENFAEGQAITRSPCSASGHAFHTECLRGWLQCARTCPLCRTDLTEASAPAALEAGRAAAAGAQAGAAR